MMLKIYCLSQARNKQTIARLWVIGQHNQINNTTFAGVEPIRVSIVSVVVVSSSVLDNPAKSLRPVLVDRNKLAFLGLTKP
jgi:alpha-D-ribose 1-methylphosphonate 5-triphosphate synthase subunit PhnL